MSHTYHVKHRFHIGYSLLGRLIRRRLQDTHFAEGVFILAFTALFIVLILLNYVGWVVLQPTMSGASGETVQLVFALSQLGLAAFFVFFAMLGFKPALQVTFDPAQGLTIEQGEEILHVPIQSIRAASQISALRFHQFHRKYKKTRAFFVRLPRALMLLTTGNGPVVLGLNASDHQELLALLQHQTEKIVFSPLGSMV